MRILLSLLLPFKILKLFVVTILKLFIFLVCCVIIANWLGDHNVQRFQESPRTEGNYSARCG